MDQNTLDPQLSAPSPTPVQPSSSIPTETIPVSSPPVNRSIYKILLILILFVVFVVGVVYAMIRLGSAEKTTESETTSIPVSPTISQITNTPTIFPTEPTASLQKPGVIEGNITVVNTLPGLTIDEITVLVVRKGSEEDPFGAQLSISKEDNTIWVIQSDSEKIIYHYRLTIESGDGIWANQTYLVSPSISWQSADNWPEADISSEKLQKEVYVSESGLAQQDFDILIK